MSKNKNISGDLALELGFRESVWILCAGLEPGKALAVMGYQEGFCAFEFDEFPLHTILY